MEEVVGRMETMSEAVEGRVAELQEVTERTEKLTQEVEAFGNRALAPARDMGGMSQPNVRTLRLNMGHIHVPWVNIHG